MYTDVLYFKWLEDVFVTNKCQIDISKLDNDKAMKSWYDGLFTENGIKNIIVMWTSSQDSLHKVFSVFI